LKVCSKCNISKFESEFGKQSKSKDKLNPWCKKCCYEYQKSYRKTEIGKKVQYKYQKNILKQNLVKNLNLEVIKNILKLNLEN